jgi:hypothetical protein
MRQHSIVHTCVMSYNVLCDKLFLSCCDGHEMFKSCQYVSNAFKLCVGMWEDSIEIVRFSSSKNYYLDKVKWKG